MPEGLSASAIFQKGKDASGSKFNYEKALDALIEKDKDGEWIFEAGDEWHQFNFEKGLEALASPDRRVFWLYMGGKFWRKFDFKKGFEALIKNDKKTGTDIIKAGIFWKKFDYKRGMEALRKIDSELHYKNDIHHLENLASEKWPVGVEGIIDKAKQIKLQSKFMPKKPFGLKEAIKTLSRELLKMPPHYEQNGYKVILTQDLDEFNIGKFLTRFRAGRVISYGQVGDMKDEFSRELVFRVIENNALKINDGFFYVVYEDV
jgi:hypothetical protein